MRACVRASVCVRACVRACVRTFVCMYMYMYECMYVGACVFFPGHLLSNHIQPCILSYYVLKYNFRASIIVFISSQKHNH